MLCRYRVLTLALVVVHMSPSLTNHIPPNQPNHPTTQAFTNVVGARRAIIRRHALLYFSTYFFDYIGAVVNYAGACACVDV